MMNYSFSLHTYLSEVKAPVFIFHGTEDEVIGIKQAKRLQQKLKTSDRLLIVEGGKHNGLNEYQSVRLALDSIWNK
jgi:dipeptidyl aminopeptidase/acylaminoacyl peptidase